jgi:hypothetical protein
MIWQMAAMSEEPRIIRSKFSSSSCMPVVRLDAGAVPPILSAINRECRREAQKVYTKVGDYFLPDSKIPNKYRGRYTYVNLENDVFYIDPRFITLSRDLFRFALMNLVQTVDGAPYQAIRHIALSSKALVKPADVPVTPYNPIHEVVMVHPQIETIKLVVDQTFFFDLYQGEQLAALPHSYSFYPAQTQRAPQRSIIGKWMFGQTYRDVQAYYKNARIIRVLHDMREKAWTSFVLHNDLTDLSSLEDEDRKKEMEIQAFLKKNETWVPPQIKILSIQ